MIEEFLLFNEEKIKAVWAVLEEFSTPDDYNDLDEYYDTIAQTICNRIPELHGENELVSIQLALWNMEDMGIIERKYVNGRCEWIARTIAD